MACHALKLKSGSTLDLDALPQRELSQEEMTEMLEACRDRIFAFESNALSPEHTPKPPRAARPSVPAVKAKALTKAQIEKEKKSVVTTIKKHIKPLKFHGGFDRLGRAYVSPGGARGKIHRRAFPT